MTEKLLTDVCGSMFLRGALASPRLVAPLAESHVPVADFYMLRKTGGENAIGCAQTQAAPLPVPGAGGLDAAAVAQLIALDPSGKNRLLERVADAFASSSARLLPQLHQSAATGDRLLLRHVVHTFKSSSANVGAHRLASLCAVLELEIRQGVAHSRPLPEATEEIAVEVLAVEAALRRLSGAAASPAQ